MLTYAFRMIPSHSGVELQVNVAGCGPHRTGGVV